MTVYLGIDWSQEKHDAVFLNQAGALLAQLTLPHSPEGFFKLDATRQQLGVEPLECLVGLETCDGRKCTSVLENGSEYSPMLNNGVPPIVVSRILEHAKPSITLDLYGHLYHEMLGGAAKIMDELVTPIKVELPSNEILDDKLHQSAPENANLPGRRVRKE